MSTAMQVRLRHWPGMKVSWLGAGAVVHSGDEPSPGAASLVVSPHGSAECAVVISSHTVKLQPAMIEELAEVLANGLPRGFAAMRFVAWDGACATNERPAAAHMIAMRLGIDVIAAAGPLLGVPGGSLFAPIGRGEQRPGGFWRFRTGVQPVRVGWRFPAPQWENDLSTDIPELPGDLVLDQIPAGLWLHRRRVGSVTDLAYSVPTDHANPSLILSHPSEEPLQRDELARAVSAIPTLAADRCVFTPYGQRPIADGPVGPVVADILGRAVHVRTGLPLCAPAGQRAVVTIDQKGLPRWRTFVRELWQAPRNSAPRPVDWINPCPDVLANPAGAATFSLGSGWVLEVVQAGLWIRPEHLSDPADWIRGLPVDVNRCAVVVGAPNAAELPPPAHAIAEILEKLPIDARKRAYLAVPRGAAPTVFILATALRDSLPEPGEVELVAPTASNPSVSTTGSFSVVQDGPRHGSHSTNGRRGETERPFLVDGRPANGHPSGAHPTVTRPGEYNAAGTRGYDAREHDTARNGFAAQNGFDPGRGAADDVRTSSFPAAHEDTSRAPRPGGIPVADQPEQFRHAATFPAPDAARTGSFPAVDAGRTAAFQPPEAATGAFPPPSANGTSFPPAGPNGTSFAPVSPNGTQRPGRGGHPVEYPAPSAPPVPRGQRPAGPEATGAFPAAGGDYGYRSNPEATAPMPPVAPAPVVPAPAVHGVPPQNGFNAPLHNGQTHNGNGHGTNGQGGPAHNGNGYTGMHPELHVAPPRAFHREDQPLHPAGPNAHGFSFDAPDYDEHHFDPVSPPSRHHDDPAGRMPAQRAPLPDEQDDQAEDTSSITTGREIRSHNKKGKATRTDDKTSTQELDRLLGFFDEIRRAKAWDEDPSTPDSQAAKRAAAGQPPAGPRRARH